MLQLVVDELAITVLIYISKLRDLSCWCGYEYSLSSSVGCVNY